MKNLFAYSSLLIATLVLSQTICSFAADSNDKSYFNVRNYGATGDGKSLDSPAIDKAIQAAADAGGI